MQTLMALGVLRDDDSLNLGMAGMHGSYAANMAISECDLLISLGARFDDRITGNTAEFAKGAKIIHVDIDPSSISKIINADYPIVGDLATVVNQIMDELNSDAGIDPSLYAPWRDTLDKFKALYPLDFDDSEGVLKPQWVIKQTAQIVGDEAIISTDVGQHQMWVAQFYPFNSPRQFLTSGGQGTMGYGLPAALGAKVAKSANAVINFTGDGSILMNIQEMMTAMADDIPVINIVLNNNFLGMVRQWQTFFYEHRFSSTDLSLQPDFAMLAASFGGVGYRVKTKDEFKKALKEALDSKKPAIIDVVIDRFENVLPMVPTGAAIYNMILDDKGKR